MVRQLSYVYKEICNIPIMITNTIIYSDKNVTVKAWKTLLNELLLAVELDITRLEIVLDSLIDVELLTPSKDANIFLSAIVCDCRSLLDRFE